MKVRDKKLKENVDVSNKACLNRDCYWPRPDPGVFTPGQGYKARENKIRSNYICGTRAVHGCPDKHCH